MWRYTGNASQHGAFVADRLREAKQLAVESGDDATRQVLARIMLHDIRAAYKRLSLFRRHPEDGDPSKLRQRRGSSDCEVTLPTMEERVKERLERKVGRTRSRSIRSACVHEVFLDSRLFLRVFAFGVTWGQETSISDPKTASTTT